MNNITSIWLVVRTNYTKLKKIYITFTVGTVIVYNVDLLVAGNIPHIIFWRTGQNAYFHGNTLVL